MNANELADILEVFPNMNVVKAAAMLRQQADRIEVLEANHKIQLNINEKALQYIEQLEQGLRASINLNRAYNDKEKTKDSRV
jgi:hypothetical protein